MARGGMMNGMGGMMGNMASMMGRGGAFGGMGMGMPGMAAMGMGNGMMGGGGARGGMMNGGGGGGSWGANGAAATGYGGGSEQEDEDGLAACLWRHVFGGLLKRSPAPLQHTSASKKKGGRALKLALEKIPRGLDKTAAGWPRIRGGNRAFRGCLC
ncbi:hypothetical protein LTR02_016183 [Friedmanniomyces endolithicus]|nr:hypothetical protein LTR02_016183 [Friedmanniomyces endolithicus]